MTQPTATHARISLSTFTQSAQRWIGTATLAVIASITLSACNAVPPLNLKSPDIAFGDLSVSDIGLSQIKFVVTVNADNKNDVDIPLTDMNFDLSLMDQSFAKGVAKEANTVIPKKASKSIPIEFTVGTSKVIDLIKKVGGGDLTNFNYALKGSAKWGSGPFSVPFERKGDLKALKSLADMVGGILK
jgi:LEA14-like dessication related protein